MKALVVDDEDGNRKLLRIYLEMHGCEVTEARNGQEGCEMAAANRPDLIISDAMMPVMDGFQFLREVKGDENLKAIPFIFYSAIYTGDREYELALSLGAEAFILKPKTPDEFWAELSNIMEGCRAKKERAAAEKKVEEEEYLREYSGIIVSKLEEKVRELEEEISERLRAQEELKKSETSYRELSAMLSNSLEELKRRELSITRSRDAFLNMLGDVSEAYKDLQELFTGLVRAMVNALDAKSPWTKGHSVRVAAYAEQISRRMGLDEDEVKDIHLAGLLHDVGKIGTYDYLLDKPSGLADEEFALVRMHPAQGEAILKEIKQLKKILPLIRHHHERIDGTGYPDGLKGEEIPLGARILHVADTYDAVMADRPYRPSLGVEYAAAEFRRFAGLQFDADIIDAFLQIINKV